MASYRVVIEQQASWQRPVINMTTTAPPGGATEGDRYVVASVASGDWTGQEGTIAMLVGSTWLFDAPIEGWEVYDADTNLVYLYNGAAWVAQDISAKADKVSEATENNLAKLDASGNLADSGILTADVSTSLGLTSGATDTATPSTLVKRDVSGYAWFVRTGPANDTYITEDGSHNLVFVDAVSGSVTLASLLGGGGATTALDNLASVAINTSLISDTDNTDDLGSGGVSPLRWKDCYLAGNLSDNTNTVTVADLKAAYDGIGSVTPTNEAADTTCFPLFSASATGNQAPHTNASLTFNASTGALGANSMVLAGTLTGVTTAITGTKNNKLTISVPDQTVNSSDGQGLDILADDGFANSNAGANGGSITLTAGNGMKEGFLKYGNGGDININAGLAVGGALGTCGSIILTPGATSGSEGKGSIFINGQWTAAGKTCANLGTVSAATSITSDNIIVNTDVYTTAWSSWSTSLSSPTGGNTVPTFSGSQLYYKRVGKSVGPVQLYLYNTSGGTAGSGTGRLLITVPLGTISAYNNLLGYGEIQNGTTVTFVFVIYYDATHVYLQPLSGIANYIVPNDLNNANSRYIKLNFTYELD